MINFKPYLLGLALWLLHLSSSFGQADPAVTGRNLLPAPIIGGVGAPLSLTFTIGNNGAVPISGANVINQMGFAITLGNCAPSPVGTGALSGPLLNYFDITYVASINSFLAQQKTGVVLGPVSVYDLVIAATVTTASSSTAVKDIGASCNIQPPPALNNQPAGNDNAAIYTYSTQAPMPVSLVSFTAKAQPDRSVLLNWSTSWEQANKAYVIEHSKDLTSYEEVGRVTDVAGTSKTVSQYQLVDRNPYRGTSYYRLRQIDLDGSSRTYPAVAVVVDGQYGVYPNPVRTQSFTLSLDEPTTAVLHFYSASGKAVTLEKGASGSNTVELKSTESLSGGVYVLTVEERGQVRTHRLVVP